MRQSAFVENRRRRRESNSRLYYPEPNAVTTEPRAYEKLDHADDQTRLLSKYAEPFEDTVIATFLAENEIENVLCKVILELSVTLSDIKSKPENDIFIIRIKETPKAKENKNIRNANAKHFSLYDKRLMYAQRVVVPAVLKKHLFKEFHNGYPEISRMKSLMRSYMYGLTKYREIEESVKSCRCCDLGAKSPPVKFKPWPKTDSPWTRPHIDFAGLVNGAYFLIVTVGSG
ncbi:uncharacterized protein K02A2.6-like [Octopus sinensis]|uniref:Uncharacterized protein K02A2.6-like n=1 Tax=Octopus sinensis TaxID=2607531 RepID=A0A6P7TMT1_9MOLL|nr:uncharacterized protein K02A2.6-like [Octopus sinensis]